MGRISCCIFLFIGFSGFSQGLVDGYFKGKGNTDIAVSTTFQGSAKFFTGTNKIDLGRSILSFSAFAEYGITKKWDIIANIPLINFQFQDAAVFTKVELVETKIGGKKFSVVPAVGISFPLTTYNTESTLAVGQRATVISPKLVFQQELSKSIFVQAQGGYNHALDPVTSSYVFSVKWGMSKGKSYTDFWFDHQTGIGGLDYLSQSFGTYSFRELGVSYNRIGGVYYRQTKEKLGLFVNYSFTINGRNTAQALGIGAGTVFKL